MKPEREPFPAVYAVRIAGKDGWQIYNPPVTKDKIVAHLEGQGLKYLEFKEILTLLKKGADFNELERMTFVNSMIMEKGWMYDSQRGCWLSPGETYSEPDKQAVVADSFDLVADPPKAGWWDIGFVINGKEYWIASSEVYDPLLDYHNLMLAVVHGRNIRITINEERCYTDISIYCKADGIIRLILKLFGTKEPTEVDVLIDGREFLQKLYILLCGFFGNRKELEKEWLMESEDLYDTKNDEAFVEYIERIKKERGYPSYPVEEIEKYLATPLTG